ncbi:hypothetical protein M758_5G191300 [Ceratodon purpureus]|uniref:Uncharacterized protein n=1 Tax=Ceratodon purpureus TaxID=3225 RepID=A0A8T0I6I4_CERPU|nr:hypothetical protein KC19_5G198600 [Ceratodon purpureus]KAG0617470.1 hypothetical protein M758_5G191300 [Ceratodon purpureus]
MVGTFTKLACIRPSHRSKHQYFLVENVGGKRISPSAGLHGVPLLESFEAVDHPAEPSEKDQPVRCPPPEDSIVQDGQVWRERVARSLRRQIERFNTWQEGDVVGRSEIIMSNSGRPDHSNLREKNLFVAHSAPEFAVSRLLEETA